MTELIGEKGISVLKRPGTAAIVAIVIRAVVAWQRGTIAAPEPYETERIVRNWLAGRGFTHVFLGTTYRSFHSLLPYDLLTAAVYSVTGGSQTAMLCMQWVCSALLVLVIGRLGQRLVGSGGVAFAVWLVAFHPGLIVYDATKLQQISFDALLVAGGVLAFVRWAESPSVMRSAVAGLLTGLLMYERGTMALFFPVAALWVKRVSGLSWAQWGRQATPYVVVASLVVLPWTVRNVLVHRRFVPMMTTTWMALWKGNNEITIGTEYVGHETILVHLPAPLHEAIGGATELQQMDAFRAAALQFIRQHPEGVLRLFFQKLRFFWWRSPHTGLLYSGTWMSAYQAWYLFFIGWALVGTRVLVNGDQQGWAIGRLILWLAVLFSAGQCVFYVAGRHRFTIEPMLALLSATGLSWMWQRCVVLMGKGRVTARC